jgi:hypothetical protein
MVEFDAGWRIGGSAETIRWPTSTPISHSFMFTVPAPVKA